MNIEKKVVKLLKTKKTSAEIKSELGISASRLSLISRRYGISLVKRNKLLRDGKSPKEFFKTKKVVSKKKVKKKIIKQIKKGLTRAEISEKYDVSHYIISSIAKNNGLTIRRASRFDKDRHKAIVKALKKGDLTYKEIGVKYGITRQRVYQFAKEYDLRRNVKSKKKKLKLIKKIEKDIKRGISYEDLIKKYNLTSRKISSLRYHGFDSKLAHRYREVRNKEIVGEYKVKPAIQVLKSNKKELDDPTRIESVRSVYEIASNNGFKKYPNIERGMKGIFVDGEVKKIIRRRKNSTKKYTNQMIADELNERGLKTAYGLEFNMATVNNIWGKMQKTTGRKSKVVINKKK